jgi:hypothetical protein
VIDAVRGADARTRHLLLSLKLGDAVRIARALAIEADYESTVSHPDSEGWRKLIERAELLGARTRDPQAIGLALAVRARAAFYRGQLRESVKLSNDAERALSMNCAYVDWDIGRVRVVRALSRYLLGEVRSGAESVLEQVREAQERGDLYTETQLGLAVGYLGLITRNEPDEAVDLLNASIREFGGKTFQAPQFLHLFGMIQTELYLDKKRPYARLMGSWPALARSQILRVPFAAQWARHLRARAALAQAHHDKENRELLLREAADSVSRLIEARLPAFVGFGHAISAGVYALRGERLRAVQRLEQAEASFYEGDMTLFAAATRYQVGRLQGGARGAELEARAEAWFEAQGTKRPLQVVGMLMPGFYE